MFRLGSVGRKRFLDFIFNKFQFDEQLKTAAYDNVGGCTVHVMLGQNVC